MKQLLITIAVVLLVGCGPNIHEATWTGNIELIKQLTDSDIDVNVKRNGGETPLHIAAIFSRYEIAKLLITKGADVNARNYTGVTPLDLAKYKKPEKPEEIENPTSGNFETCWQVGHNITEFYPAYCISCADFNGDGSLSYEEFSESLVSITGQRAPQTALKAIFSAIDKDGNGGLDLREIISSFGGQITAPVNELSGDSSLVITGHANDEYNGNYKLQNSPLNGQPWFKNTKNPSSAKILYYYN